jgi:hypothetical protein
MGGRYLTSLECLITAATPAGCVRSGGYLCRPLPCPREPGHSQKDLEPLLVAPPTVQRRLQTPLRPRVRLPTQKAIHGTPNAAPELATEPSSE